MINNRVDNSDLQDVFNAGLCFLLPSIVLFIIIYLFFIFLWKRAQHTNCPCGNVFKVINFGQNSVLLIEFDRSQQYTVCLIELMLTTYTLRRKGSI